MTDLDPTKIEISTDDESLWMKGWLNHSRAYFEVPYITHLAGNLWMGGCWSGLVLPDYINHVVSLYPWEKYEINHDATREEIWVYDSTDDFDPTVYIDAAYSVVKSLDNGPVLVHCQAGINRSSLVSGLVLVISGAVEDGQKAIELIREKRLSNPVFREYLRSFRK